MPRVLFLFPTATYRAEAFLAAARKLKVSVTIGCEQPDLWDDQTPGGLVALNFQDLEYSQNLIKTFNKTYPLDSIIGVEDTTTFLAASLSAALNLPHNSSASVAAARNKFQMRNLLKTSRVPIPNFSVYSIDEDPQTIAQHIRYPCVVKPLILSASCGVIRADDAESFCTAFTRVKTLLIQLGLTAKEEAAHSLLVEDFVAGIEVAVEGLLTNETLQVLAVFDKPDPLDGPFFEETIYVTPSRLPPETQEQVANTLQNAAVALGLREGPVHGELRINDSGVWVIELAARSIGGRCSQALRFGSGVSLEELILRHALRMDLPTPELQREDQAAGVMMLPIRHLGYFVAIQGQSEARNIPGIESLEITAQPGDLLVPLPEGTRYLGFLRATGTSPEIVEQALRQACDCLQVQVTPLQSQPMKPGIIKV